MEVPILNDEELTLNLNGIYFIEDSKKEFPTGFMFLYKDGSIYISNIGGSEIDSLFWSNPLKYLTFLESKWPSMTKTTRNFWGYYKIRNDSIYIQHFRLNDQYWMKRNTIELLGIIKDENTILISKEICKWCHVVSSKYDESGINDYTPPTEYKYFPSEFKPDSTEAWFKSQSWYKKENRK
ncbi:MAG TPA: hypothetical protein VFW78_11760 [Bacteroidia bacterium]|nr:hypothetical protein [Bacteroidia bacterium]